MKALVYHSPGVRAYEEKPMPVIKDSTDAIVRITKTTICGTDLHIMKGDVPTVTDGRILGHEGVGIIEEVGGNVSNFRVGEHVLISCISSCGRCANCKKGMYSPSEIIVVDNDDNRLEVAKKLGATRVVYNNLGNAAEKIMQWTNNRGVDVAVEAIGIPVSFDICQAIVTAGGHIANVGVHGKPVQLNLDKLWSQNITLTTRLVDTITTPMLLNTLISGKLQPQQLITHHFTMDEVMQAYDTFDNAMKEEALKVIITNSIMMSKAIHASEIFGDVMLERQPLTEQLLVNDSLGG